MFYLTRRKQRDLTESRVARFKYPVIKRCLLAGGDLILSLPSPHRRLQLQIRAPGVLHHHDSRLTPLSVKKKQGLLLFEGTIRSRF